MLAPSFRRSPVAPVLSARSEPKREINDIFYISRPQVINAPYLPARSTKLIVELSREVLSPFVVIWSKEIHTRVCALELDAFMLVAAIVRLAVPVIG